MDSCAGWIEVTIYPVYAFGLVVAALLTSQGPPPWVLVLQAGIQGPVGRRRLGVWHALLGTIEAWLLQAWVPVITEWGLQMQFLGEAKRQVGFDSKPLGSLRNTRLKFSVINEISLDSSCYQSLYC